jgi:hypothetical protein
MHQKNLIKTSKNKAKLLRLKVGLVCVFAAIFSMAAVFLTSLDDIFFPLTFVLMFCGIVLVISSGKLVGNRNMRARRSYFDPRNPFGYYFDRHR